MIAVNVVHEHLLERAERIAPELIRACEPRGPLCNLPRDPVTKLSRAAHNLAKAVAELNAARGRPPVEE